MPVAAQSETARLTGRSGRLLALALILIVDGIVSPNFFEIRIVEGRLFGNVVDILYRAVPTALVALGMAVVIGTKGIDLSVGSIIAICRRGDRLAHPRRATRISSSCSWPSAPALLCGMWNGMLVAGLGIQPIIATLILMVSGRGIGLLINLLYGGTDPSFDSPLAAGPEHRQHLAHPDPPVRRAAVIFVGALAGDPAHRARPVHRGGRRQCGRVRISPASMRG